jgi:hypothetical protein
MPKGVGEEYSSRYGVGTFFFTRHCITFSGLTIHIFISVDNYVKDTEEYVAVEAYLHTFLISVLGDVDRFTPRKEGKHPLNIGLGGHQRLSGHFGEEEKLL